MEGRGVSIDPRLEEIARRAARELGAAECSEHKERNRNDLCSRCVEIVISALQEVHSEAIRIAADVAGWFGERECGRPVVGDALAGEIEREILTLIREDKA
jgi:hypothetical protein